MCDFTMRSTAKEGEARGEHGKYTREDLCRTATCKYKTRGSVCSIKGNGEGVRMVFHKHILRSSSYCGSKYDLPK